MAVSSCTASRGLAWTKLASTAAVGATQITLLQSPNWRVGDRIVLASTDFDPFQAEEVTITARQRLVGDIRHAAALCPLGRDADGEWACSWMSGPRWVS